MDRVLQRPTEWWRSFLGPAAILLVLLYAATGWGEDVSVPLSLQSQLLAKVAGYDRNFTSRAGDRAKIVLLVRPGNAQSIRTATEMQRELASVGAVGGLPHDETITPYAGPAALRAQCENDRISIVFVGPGFSDDIEAIRAALDDANVISAAAVPEYVPKGLVLGFDLVSGKPTLLVHLTQARKQHVNFSSSLLKLMKVYE
jgi:hypothetical protein